MSILLSRVNNKAILHHHSDNFSLQLRRPGQVFSGLRTENTIRKAVSEFNDFAQSHMDYDWRLVLGRAGKGTQVIARAYNLVNRRRSARATLILDGEVVHKHMAGDSPLAPLRPAPLPVVEDVDEDDDDDY